MANRVKTARAARKTVPAFTVGPQADEHVTDFYLVNAWRQRQAAKATPAAGEGRVRFYA